MSWKGGKLSLSRNQQPTYGQQHVHGFIGVALAPSTPIIYGNGTMLSDIGEVTEAESTPGNPSPTRYVPSTVLAVPPVAVNVSQSESDTTLRSSPKIGKGGSVADVKLVASIRKRSKAAQRDRRSSTHSDSTSSEGGPPPAASFVDVDDTASVGDSVFQGDDEESLASSYVDDLCLAAPGPAILASGVSRDAGHKYTTAQLSRRAEQILANAKKRLTHMEDNLSRARSSLLLASPRPSSEASTPSPPISRAPSALIMSTTGQRLSTGHQRMPSENTLRIGLPIKVYQQRSSSALETSSASRERSLTSSKSADQLNGQYTRNRTSYVVRDGSLDPLGENDVLQPVHRFSATPSPTFGVTAGPGLTRLAYSAQIRDIKDHVKDLKSNISSLRDQARADSLQRRSLQSLGTPSPFTYAPANHWYGSGPMGSEINPCRSIPEDSSSPDNDPSSWNHSQNGSQHSDSVEDSSPVHSYCSQGEDAEQFDYQDTKRSYQNEIEIDGDLQIEDGGPEKEEQIEELALPHEEAVEDGCDVVSESGYSIYHESVQHQLSHEDREDAFDYEHFILHSAMGTISRHSGRRDSASTYGSGGSEDSVETTKGPVTLNVPAGKLMPLLSRRGSERSISTTESFATATEGLESRQDSVAALNKTLAEVEPRTETGGNDAVQEALPMLVQTTPGPIHENLENPEAAERLTLVGVGFQPPAALQPSRASGPHSAMRQRLGSSVTARPHATLASSFESGGMTRSFPLVNKTSTTSGTPDSGRKSSIFLFKNQEGSGNGGYRNNTGLQSINSTTSLVEQSGSTGVMETLPQDDRFLVERLVASLGRCVLGLTETGRATKENHMYRRRIDAARKVLEGLEPV